MTTPEGAASDGAEPESTEPVPGVDFDPYRFGAPEHPIPPEYAPPGYAPPGYAAPVAAQPSPWAPPPPQSPPPPYYGQQPPYPPPYHQYPQPSVGSPGKAVAALVLGIASVVFFWLTVFDVIPIILTVIFGAISISEANRTPGRPGYRMAVAGILCAVVGAIAAAIFFAVVWHDINNCGGTLNLNNYSLTCN